ncbi:MAG: CHRD domain-containing protein [bacterium]|nr:CHRD domain-containing protein [bacterium]
MKNALRAITLILFAAVLAFLMRTDTLLAQHDHQPGDPRPERETESVLPLNPAGGSEIGFVYEAYLSPQQEGGEEEDTPAFVPPQFRSTAPSVPRNERTSRGHAVIEFTRDLSRAYVHLAVENVNPADIVMLHLHCGRPGQLGPIIIDFGLIGNVQEYLADGTMRVEVHNEDITAVTDSAGLNPIDGFTLGCPIVPSVPNDKVKTIGGMQLIAEQGELYFNLHTAGQVYFGDIRGQFSRVDMP